MLLFFPTLYQTITFQIWNLKMSSLDATKIRKSAPPCKSGTGACGPAPLAQFFKQKPTEQADKFVGLV
jgi:hypothetical protein